MSAHGNFGLPWNFWHQFFDWSIFSKYDFRLVHSKYRNAAFFVKLVKAKGKLGWKILIDIGMPRARELIIGGREKSYDVTGCCRTKPEHLLEVGIPNEQEVHRAYARHQNGQLWLLCSDDRGAKVMVLLGYIPLTTKQMHWLEFVMMSTVKLQGLFVSHVKGWC